MSRFILCIGISFLFLSSLHAQTFNGAGGVIPDAGAQTCFPINVTGVGTINGTYGLASVCLNINHTWDSDLEIYLQAPDGTMVPLSLQNGIAGVNYTGTCFTATAATSINLGIPPYTGNFLPEGPLGAVNNGQNANGVWTLCIQDLFLFDGGNLINWSILFNNTPAPPPVVPTNDNPCNAIPLTVGNNVCTYAFYTNENATATAGVPAPGCSNYVGGDVWFQVTVPAGGALIFDSQTGAITDGGMAIYSGTCNALTLVACDDDLSANGLMPMIAAGGLTPGSTIWIRFWEYGNDNPGTFGICVSTPPPPPTNDNPCNSFPLAVNATCNFSTYTNVGSTGTVGVPAPGCGNYQGNDVWFSVTVPVGGSVFLNSNSGSMTNGSMAVYSGACNALTLIRCDDNSSSNPGMPSMSLTGLTPGSTIWIRFWGNGLNNTGTFQICAAIPPPPTVQDCPAAIPICQNVYNEPVSYTGTGNIPNEIDPTVSCLAAGERSDVWYTFTVQTSGNLDFTITPNNFLEDYDWAVYNLTNATCADIFSNDALNVSCNFSATGGDTGPNGGSGLTWQDALGTPFNAVIPVVAGETYVINVSNYSLSTNGYSIDFGASTASIFDNSAPVLQSVSAASTCGGSQLSVNFSENILCNTVQNADFAVTGPGGPYTVTGWASASCTSGATYGNNITLTLSPAITSNGAFQVCLTNASGSVADLCGNLAVPACLDFTIATTIPSFPVIAPICSGSTAPLLPTTSTNGVTGTWSPATVNNTTTGSYTFTPNIEQCAVPITITVTVTPPGTVPTFNAVTPICSGATAPVLPTTSTNGITGTWSPATVSNTTTTTYTFTPGAGQCAVTTTLIVTVNPPVTSTTNVTICADQLPYSWNSQSYPAAGTYSVTLTSSAGCDSVATLNLTVSPLVISTTNVTICVDQLPYSWNSQSYPAAGTYSVTLTSSAGCDSVATLNLTVSPLVISTTNVTICFDQLPYSWNSQSYPAAGTYSVTLTSSAGCDSIATLNLTVNPVVTSTTNITICDDQLPYSWNSQSYPTGGTYSVTFVSSLGCDSIATLNLTVNPVVTSTTNVTICDDQLPYSWNSQSYPAAGTYSVTLTSSAGCDSIATLNLTVNPVVTSTTNITICDDQLPFSWNSQSYPAAGTYSVTLVNSLGCDSIATLNLTVNPTVTSTTNVTICDDQLPYSWNSQSYPAAGTYSVTLTSSAGCDSIATLNLAVNTIVTSTTGITICSPQLPYSWNSQSYPAAGTYSVTLTSSAGCDSIATLNLTVIPIVTSITNVTICDDQLPYSWNSQSYLTGGTYSVTLTGSAGCDSIPILNLTVSAVVTSTTNITICDDQLPYSWNSQSHPAAGTYSVTLVSSLGCDSIATLNLAVNPVVTSTTNITICDDQLPFSWNSQSYPAAGTYSVTLVSSLGCDSIATLNLAVNPVVTSTTNVTICDDQLPYSWNSQSYPAAGTYSVTLVSSLGCDSIATLNLAVNPVVTSTTNITICDDQLPYSWNSQSYPGAGTYSVTLTSSLGCDSIATLNLAVNPVVTSTTNITICDDQLPYSWNSQSYPGAGTYSVTLVSSLGCDSIATLNLSVNPVVTSTTNVTICDDQLPYSWNSQSYPAAGTYSVTLVSSLGCDSIATLNLTVNPVVTSTTNITICDDQLPFSWNSQSYPAAGTYSVTLVSSLGCDSIATLNLAVNPVVTSTTNVTICDDQLPYSWNSQSYPAAGTYSVTLVSSLGCDSIATLNLAVNPVVTSTTNITICDDQLPYSWNSQSYPGAGTYSVTLTSSLGCDSIATLNLAVNPVVTSTTNITICDDQLPYSWNSQSYPGAGTYSVTLVSSLGCDSIATLNLSVNPVVTSTTNVTICDDQLPYSWNSQSYPAAGTYSVTLTSSLGCDSVATLNLVVNPVVTSTTNVTICDDQLPYSWNSQSYPAAGTYSVTLTSSLGCDSVATLNLVVNPVVTSTTNVTICDDQLPYSWNSQSYLAAGTYSVTLVSNLGCDSIATLNLAVNPVVTSTTNVTICDDQLPYSWNSQSYPAAGTYSVTLVSSAGCDSIATLNLAVNPVVTSTTNITICDDQLPYSWNSQSYPAAGTYSVTLVSSLGCDSVATLNLVVNPVVTSTTNITICDDQLPYSWNSQSYPTGGTYSVTLTSSAGCDSIATLNLTVNAVVTSTTDITICSSQLPYSWNSQSYPTGGTYSVILISSAGCDSIATLNLTANAIVTSTTDITICSSQLPYSWNSQSYPTGGIYSVTLTSSAGCDSIATLNLTANAVVTSTTDITICSPQLPYSWNSQSYLTGGTYSVTLTSSAGCDSIATLNLTVIPIVTSTTNVTICNDQLPYSWNSQSYPTGGTYSVTLTSSTGCDSIPILNLTVNAVVTSTTDITICSSQLPYSWNSQSYPTGGTYSVTLMSSAGCDSIATLNLTANDAVTSTTDITICSSQLPYSWNSQSYPAGGTYSVTLISSAGCDSIATLNLTANDIVTSTTDITICSSQLPYSWNSQSYPAGGTYSVTLISSAGCDSIATLNLTTNDVVTSTTDITICSTQLPYSWNSQSYPAGGTYSVTLISSAGCDSIATLNLTANDVVTSTTDITICSSQLPYSWNSQSYPTGGTYSVTLTSSVGCDSIATLNLTANDVVTSTTDITICSSQLPYSWNSQSYPAGGTYSVTLISSAGCDSIATLNLTANDIVTSTTDITICSSQLPYSWNSQSYPAGGTYSVTLISSAGCDSIATLNLTANDIVTSTTDITICSSQLPYSWNSQSYPSGGTYSVTLTSSAGCDSIATLNLTANDIVTSTTDITICSSQLPYSWNSQSYPAGGTYSVTLISSAGCDSIATLNLTTNDVVTSTTDITICSSQLPYSWNSQSYPAGGTYSVTLISSVGCDSIATLNLTTNDVVTSTTDITICSSQLPYSWNSQSYPTGGTYSVTLTSSAGCDSIATLNLTANDVVTSTTDITICSSQLPYSWNSQSYPTGGTYSVTLTSSAGCDSIATLNLTANDIVTSTTDITICSSQLPYSWNSQSYPTGGTYSVTLISSAGCDSIATLNLTANDIVTSTTDITICSSQLPYSWNSQSYPAGGTYSVTLISSAGCDSIATLNLTANDIVTSTTDITICSSQLPYSWNSQLYPAGGTYSVTLTSSAGCDSIATLNLTANDVVTSTTDITICTSQLPYSWNSQSYPTGGTYSVTLTSSAGCDSIATLNLTANDVVTSATDITICSSQLPYSWNSQSYPTGGTYSVTLTSSAGCDSIATLNLTANDIVTSTTDITICSSQLPYSWNSQLYPAGGTYSVTLISSAGCDSIATLNLTANDIVTSTTDITICSSQLPYSWNSQSYPTGGTYSVTLTSSVGCDSIATLNLTANDVVTSTTDITICSSQLPYSWNSQSYPAGGTYSVTLISSVGCDSIATLNLTANDVITSTTNITICDDELPYSWNGQSYPTGGTYAVTLTSTAGCDSIATLNLAVNPVVTSTTNITICSNFLPYSWNGQSYPAGGTYSVTLTSNTGCDSIATLNLGVNFVTTSTTNVTICSDLLPYNWNGQSYASGGTHVVTLVNTTGCDSIATLYLTVNPVVSSITNASTCTNLLPYNWNGQSYSTGGAHVVTLTSSAGCDSIATLNLVINPLTTSTTNINTCSNLLPFNWNGQSYSATGTYAVTLTGSSGCDSIATLILTVNPVVSSTTNITVCSSSLPYTWNGQSYSTGGAHVVTLTSSAGCDSIATLNLTINPTPPMPSVVSPVIYCQYATAAALSASATGSLLWYSSASGGTGSSSVPTPSTEIAGITHYYVSQTINGCESPRAAITVRVFRTPKPGPDKEIKICTGNSADLTGLYNTSGFTSSWTLNQVTVTNPASVNVAGIYQLIALSPAGCADTALVTLIILPPVIAYAGPDGNAEYNMPYQLTGSGGVQYEWTPGSPLLNNPYLANPLAILTENTTFSLIVRDEAGCKGFDTVNIKVFKGPAIHVPTAFTPNGDGLNDIFRPTAVGIQRLDYFRVFNRYGELLYETHDISRGWDGLYKGLKQNINNYVWTLKAVDRKGKTWEMKGNVVLIR